MCWSPNASALDVVGITGVNTYYFEATAEECVDEHNDPDTANSCVIYAGGTFEALVEGVAGPTLERPTFSPGTPNPDLGPFEYSRYDLTYDDESVSVMCWNFYESSEGVMGTPSEARTPEPCQDEDRCAACVAVNDWQNYEIVWYGDCNPEAQRQNCEDVQHGTLVIY